MSSNKLDSIADGAVVGLYYTLKNEAGDVLDSNRSGGSPLVYLHGQGSIVPGLEKALLGKAKDDFIDIMLEPEDGYGQPNPELVQEVPRSAFPEDAQLEVGMRFSGHDGNGHTSAVQVSKIDGDTISVDANHPLAGIKLHFEVTVAGIREASEEEMKHGHAHGPGGHNH